MLVRCHPLQERLTTKVVSRAYPAKPSNKEDALDRMQATPQRNRVPVQHYEVKSVERGLEASSRRNSLLILVFLDFRDQIHRTAMLPLAMGLAWTWGLFSLAGMHYTAANIIAFPLILGIAIDSGVHILHRYRQEKGEKISEIVRYTGKAILLSGFTTMAGFGALTTASHRGAQSIGFVLLMGTSTGLVAAIMVLPALLKVTGLRTQKDGD